MTSNPFVWLLSAYVLWAVVYILLFGIFSAAIAVSRGRSGVGWFLIGLLFPAFGLLVGVMPVLEDTDGTRQCPACAETVKAEAVKCRFCQSGLESVMKEEKDPSTLPRGCPCTLSSSRCSARWPSCGFSVARSPHRRARQEERCRHRCVVSPG